MKCAGAKGDTTLGPLDGSRPGKRNGCGFRVMKTGKILKGAVVAAGMTIGVALILISFYAYVIMPNSLSREDMEFYVKEAGDIPFYYARASFQCNTWLFRDSA